MKTMQIPLPAPIPEGASPLGLGLGASAIMSSPVRSVRATAPVREAAQIMAEHKVSGLVVLDRQGKGVGVLSASDIVAYEVTRRDRLPNGKRYENLKAKKQKQAEGSSQFEWVNDLSVQEVMMPTIVTAPLDATIGRVAWLMSQKRIHRVFLVKEGKIKGIVTALDVARTLGRAFGPACSLS